MRYIFIDCGSHIGQSVKSFQETKLFSQHPWEIFCFEANPFLNHLVLLEEPFSVNFQQKAVWIKDGTIQFFIDKDPSCEGSSVCEKKTSGKLDKDHPVVVHCVDLSQWIVKNFKKDDEIILKMDIEGAEYEVLEKMFKDNSISYINTLYIELHAEKIGLDPQREITLLNKIKKLPIKLITEEEAKTNYSTSEIKIFDSIWFSKSEKLPVFNRINDLEKKVIQLERQNEWNIEKFKYLQDVEISKVKTRINELKDKVKVKFTV